MNRTTIKWCFPFLAAWLTAGVLGAQPTPEPEPHPVPEPNPMEESLYPPEMIMENQRRLGLTEEQRNYIKAEFQAAQAKFTGLEWDLRVEMDKLIELIRRDAVDESQAVQQLGKVLTLESEIKKMRLLLDVRIKNKLTSEQKSLLDKIRRRPSPGAR